MRIENVCQLRKGTSCQLVSELSLLPIEKSVITDEACRQCLAMGKGNVVNTVTIGVSISLLHRNGLFSPKKHAYLVNAVASAKGVGRILSEMLSWIAKPDDGDCYCNSRAAIMDVWGPVKCEEEMETIVGWLLEGAEKHKVDWVPKSLQASTARILTMEAIRKAKKYAKAV